MQNQHQCRLQTRQLITWEMTFSDSKTSWGLMAGFCTPGILAWAASFSSIYLESKAQWSPHYLIICASSECQSTRWICPAVNPNSIMTWFMGKVKGGTTISMFSPLSENAPKYYCNFCLGMWLMVLGADELVALEVHARILNLNGRYETAKQSSCSTAATPARTCQSFLKQPKGHAKRQISAQYIHLWEASRWKMVCI
jgi:hypothetical protein